MKQHNARRALYRGLSSLTLLAMLTVAGGGIAPAAFAQTTSTSTSDTGSTTEPTYCNSTATQEGYYVTTDMSNYTSGQNINFCFVNDTRNPMFINGTHPWEITDQNGNVIYAPAAGTLDASSTGSYYFNDSWNGTNVSNTSIKPDTYTVVFSGYPGSPSASFTIVASSSSSDLTGSTTGTTTGSTSSTTISTSTSSVDWNGFLTQLESLEASFSNLIQQIQAALNNSGTNSGTGTDTTGPATIDQNGQMFHVGSTIDFSGRNFMHEENVTVRMNGSTVATAHADGGGNFSTGSFSAPTTPGSYTYTFSGQNGDTAQATITVH